MPAGVVLVGAVVAAVVLLRTSGGVPLGGSLPPPLPLSSYRIQYAVEVLGRPSGAETRTESRPFLGRYESRDGNGRLVSGLVSNASGSYAYVTSPTGHWVPIAAGAHRAAGDQQAGWALRAALQRRLAGVAGTDVVTGRRCTIVRTGKPLGSPLTRPTDQDHADLCVEAHGLVLREEWTSGGRLVRTRTATALTIDPHLPPTAFLPSPVSGALAPGTDGTTTVLPVTPQEMPSLRLYLPPPPGYTSVGAQAETTFGPDGPTTVVVSHFVDGPDLLDLEQGELSQPPPTAVAVELGAGRAGLLVLDPTASYVDVDLPGGLTARVEGTDVDRLITAAAAVEER